MGVNSTAAEAEGSGMEGCRMGMGVWEYDRLTTRGSELFSSTGMSPVVSRYVPV